MLRNLILLFVLPLCFGTSMSLKAQDPIFSQYYNTPLQINPALTGNTFTPKLAVNYRNQWPNFPFAYTTYTASYDQFFEPFNSGLGGFILTDNAGNGSIVTNKIGLSYSYSLEFRGNRFVKIGIEPSFLQTRLNWDKLVFGSQIDGKTGVVTPGGIQVPGGETVPTNLNKNLFDLGVGMVYFSKVFHFGLSVKHINSSRLQFIETGKTESITGLPLRYVVHSGAQFEMKALKYKRLKSYLSPQLLFVHQGPFNQINIGTQLSIGVMHYGVWYRNVFSNSDALIVSLGVEAGVLKATYSFDFTVSGFGINQGGAHEVGLLFLFGQKKKKQNYNDCFEIFR